MKSKAQEEGASAGEGLVWWGSWAACVAGTSLGAGAVLKPHLLFDATGS